MSVLGGEIHCQGAFGLGSAVVKTKILLRRSVKVFAVKSNAKVNSKQTDDGSDVMVICREKHCHFS